MRNGGLKVKHHEMNRGCTWCYCHFILLQCLLHTMTLFISKQFIWSYYVPIFCCNFLRHLEWKLHYVPNTNLLFSNFKKIKVIKLLASDKGNTIQITTNIICELGNKMPNLCDPIIIPAIIIWQNCYTLFIVAY